MKKLLLLILLFGTVRAIAQPYGNEWIQPGQTYYKFSVISDGLYRIPQSALNSAGLGSTDAASFQLFRNGVEVPVYTSKVSGVLTAGDYIEFYGRMNDGVPDRPLYRNPLFQHTQKWSLETDTATYFLTVNTTGTPVHYSETPNDLSNAGSLTTEPYFMYSAGNWFRNGINPGLADVVDQQYIYSSSYDKGEFYSSDYARSGISSIPASPVSADLTNLYLYAGGPVASLKFGVAGCSDTFRTAQVKVSNTLVKDTVLNGFNDLVSTIDIPAALINSTSTNFLFLNNSQAKTYQDRMVVSFFELRYPRQFNFGGAANFPFTLPARATPYLLRITNFNFGGTPPVLYDESSGERFTGSVTAGVVSFVLPGTAGDRKLVLVSEDGANIKNLSLLKVRNFINYTDAANQGNYLIISNTVLYAGSSGNNPVADYASYRSSSTGGSFDAKVMDIDELADQFAFGIRKSPLAIKNFVNFAMNNYAQKPQNVLLIGRGVTYPEYRQNQGTIQAEQLNLVPTFGSPASDVMLASLDGFTNYNRVPIGRVGAITGTEVEDYLSKVKQYEQVQQTSPNTAEGRAWRKNIMHITGATTSFLETLLCNYMTGYGIIASDTLYGGNVLRFCSSTIDNDNQVATSLFPQLFSDGVGLLTYFGHSSASVLGFNLDDPSVYNNTSKYPVFLINGCYAGNFFTYDPGRLSGGRTLSENYVLIRNKGAIAFVASTHYGVVSYLNLMLNDYYTQMSHTDYGKSIGTLEADVARNLVTSLPTDFLARCQSEEMNIHGDPAITLSDEKLADYDIETQNVKIAPAFVSVSGTSFDVTAKIFNLGKAVPDSISLVFTRKYPDGSSTVVLKKRIRGIRFADSLTISVPIIATRDKGQNYITVTVNSDNDVPEITLANNSITTPVFIYEDELSPVFPYNYAIVNNPVQKLYASTANPFALQTQYVMEMDTTELFNSSQKLSKNISSVGGVLEFDPGITYRDSTVYYWRTSKLPVQGGVYNWNGFSFIYIDSTRSSAGFNQSHYFQQLNTLDTGISLGSDRRWKYGEHFNNLSINQAIYPTSGTGDADFGIKVNGLETIASACIGYSLIFNVFDPVTFKPWKNVNAMGQNLYLSGSAAANCATTRNYNFEFSTANATERYKMMRFMDSIPNGYYVTVRNISGQFQGDNTYAADWQADTTLFGSDNSLYHKLKSAGFANLDSFSSPRAFAFVYRKNDPDFVPKSKISIGLTDPITLTVDCPSLNTTGGYESPAFGPAKKWKEMHWRGASLEDPGTDSVGVQIIGVDTAGTRTLLYSLEAGTKDFDISAVDAVRYPYIRLKLRTTDTVYATPFQLKYWRLNYTPVPEGALAPNLYLTVKDTVELGEPISFGIAFKNISLQSFDSLKINFRITDAKNVTHNIPLSKFKPLLKGDTVKFVYQIDSKAYPGANTIFLDMNPDNAQPEQFHFNNFLYKTCFVRSDKTNPLLDVTFDNVHILNEDIVSAKPHIQIKLKDEAKFLLLSDTSVLKVSLRYPDGSLHPYSFKTDTLRFTPATSSADNTATVDFAPVFNHQIDPNGDTYTLIVTGSDKSGNASGTIQYQINFKIITKAMISNMLNYPNPFTTSTAFVFTITGSDVPQNIKIQILTITGKVVREITKDELGPLHVGRNITEFKWDGTDMYHQRLAIGVYLYHVVTNLNGKSLDKYKQQGDNTDQYFNKGYGKMYLMK